jgi:hypothetical protein
MSLNKTLDRLFDEIRREAKRNPDFADRLDAVLRLHDSRRDVGDEVVEDVAREKSAPALGGGADAGAKLAEAEGGVQAKRKRQSSIGQTAALPDSSPAGGGASKPPLINPVGLFKREGEDGLTAALTKHDIAALRALLVEHNLDPSGEAVSFNYDELAAHIVAQAKRRAERDEKMFDY